MPLSTTNSKSCPAEDGPILVRADGKRVRIGRYTAIICVNTFAQVGKRRPIEYYVYLDFASHAADRPEASVEATAVIEQLFSEFATDIATQ